VFSRVTVGQLLVLHRRPLPQCSVWLLLISCPFYLGWCIVSLYLIKINSFWFPFSISISVGVYYFFGIFKLCFILIYYVYPMWPVSLDCPFLNTTSVFRLLTDFVCLYTYEFWLSLCKIVRSSVILLLPLFSLLITYIKCQCIYFCLLEMFNWGITCLKIPALYCVVFC
jgi:hypothetical protein